MLPFHHREAKVGWWAYFDRKKKAQLSPDELIDDGEAIASAEWTGMEERPSARTGADIHHFRFDPSQPLKLHGGDGDKRLQLELPDTGLKLDVDALDAEQGRVSLKLPWSKRDQRIANGDGEGIPKGPTSLIKVPADISKSLRDSLEEQAGDWIDHNQKLPAAIQQLLERQPLPALKALNVELKGDPNQVGGLLTEFLASNSGITLALQGPPGTGKSTVTGQVIAQLAKQGQRIAISSNSHAAINNLLKKAKRTCADAGVNGQVVKCSNSKEEAMAEAGMPWSPGLAGLVGLEPHRLLLAEVPRLADLLWIAGEAAPLPGLCAVILEMRGNPAACDLSATRRLHMRARHAGRPVILLRQAARPEAGAALLRLLVRAAPSAPASAFGVTLDGTIGNRGNRITGKM